jgi:hypothetical protein
VVGEGAADELFVQLPSSISSIPWMDKHDLKLDGFYLLFYLLFASFRKDTPIFYKFSAVYKLDGPIFLPVCH